MSKYLPEGWTQDKIEERLEMQRNDEFIKCSCGHEYNLNNVICPMCKLDKEDNND